ncbi:uncharacterized protein A1O9_06922 [Exophiala aquamarina CBS 119918]|uniref:DUF1446 domain-containing protein n=1 Tax=Exophiala aquamarina CBS 119918 TaxID=1182545 RepID=A0A072PAF7_9EURO|nr:uncharacterized protein A1O9_06922 [Exophiala aquamarina CBS 119918]KEF56732.1 hypothetical protein A1O9_06922 [Exophiala aquamarina CBS 119918]
MATHSARQHPRSPLRVAGASGGVYDRKRAIHDLAKNEDLDFIVGDWMSEASMTLRGADRYGKNEDSLIGKAYEPYFLEQIAPALQYLEHKHIKVCINAGGSDPKGLADAVRDLIAQGGYQLKVGFVTGDDVTHALDEVVQTGHQFVNLNTGQDLADWPFDPISAQCYLGAGGIVAVLEAGADIVVCGRVADASVCVGPAMYWHGWTRDNMDELANTLMVGHIIECSTYATGGYYSGFKELGIHDTDMGYPIAAIDHKGEAIVYMEQGRDGLVSPATITSQLLYEIQGLLYYNSDVTANIENIRVEAIGKNQVRVSGVKGLPPPSTTRLGITAKGGYQAEFHFYLTGLDIKEKFEMVKRQTLATMGDNVKRFSCLKFTIAGTVPEDPDSQDQATVDMRIFAQSREPEVLSAGGLVESDRGSFARYCVENLLQGYPGSTMAIDMRQALGKPFFEYFPTLLPQKFVKQVAHHPDGTSKAIESPKVTAEYPKGTQASSDTVDPVDLTIFGPTTKVPLGYIVMGRSGDKSSNCNVGLFVRHEDEWDWLRTVLSMEKMKELLGKDYKGGRIERCELPNILAVHFHLIDHLERGYTATSGYDCLGKNCCEYIRSRKVDIPNKFLARGRI